ncbi:MAG: sulfatase [Chloroflexota bacterium]
MTDRPHILLLTCHDIGRHLGCYGVETVHTPHLDALAADGVRFDRAFTVSPGCSPSRAALATGRYPHANGVMGLTHPPFFWDLHAGERHIAAILGDAGYETRLFGHQHVTPHAGRLGFQHLHGFDRNLECQETALGAGVGDRLDAFVRRSRTGKPLYIEINLEEPHRPYDQGGAVPDASKGITIPGYLPDNAATQEEMAALQGAIRQADHAVGRILASLRAAGMDDDLLVIVMADHGLAMPRAKSTLYDPGLEIALLMRWPRGGLTGGRVDGDMISIVDLVPTILDTIDLPVPPGVQGLSFAPRLRDKEYRPRDAIYAEKTYHSYYDPMRAIRTDRFKYIRNFEAAFLVEVPGDVQAGAIFRTHAAAYSGGQHPPVELYDLNADRWERHNLAGQSAYAVEERRLDERLWTWMTETGDPLLHGAIQSPSIRRALATAPAPAGTHMACRDETSSPIA